MDNICNDCIRPCTTDKSGITSCTLHTPKKNVCVDCIGCEVDSKDIIKEFCNSFIPSVKECIKPEECKDCMECTYETKLD